MASLRSATIRLAHSYPELREHLLPLLGKTGAGPEKDVRIVREALSILPKRSSFSSFKVEDGQAQYWFDLTYPFTDWAYKKGVKSSDPRAHEAYFSALLKKAKPKLAVYGAVPVVREMFVVIVVE
jgi:hypothetical protein